jgi:hypothetical protein
MGFLSSAGSGLLSMLCLARLGYLEPSRDPVKAMGTLREGYRSMRKCLIRSTRRPRVGLVQTGDFDHATSISRDWGFDRDRPIGRLSIERVIAAHVRDIRGDGLEVSNEEANLLEVAPQLQMLTTVRPVREKSS